jgi:hypothetical protein
LPDAIGQSLVPLSLSWYDFLMPRIRSLPFLLTILLLPQLFGCIPNLARTNARIEKGFDATFSVGVDMQLPGKDEHGKQTQTTVLESPIPELDLQFGNTFENTSGLAVQFKIPLAFYASTLDFYFQLPKAGRWYFGLGTEVGLWSAAYLCTSYYFSDRTYLTLTPRLAAVLFDEGRQSSSVMLNPQLALGWAGDVDFSVFASYGYMFGKGIDACIMCDDKDDYRKQFILSGVALRF